jgi:hypothetical protein
MPSAADMYLEAADHRIGQTEYVGLERLERARLNAAEAQVNAIQAVAVALDRLAQAVEGIAFRK